MTTESFTIGAAVVTRTRVPGVITGYSLARQKYLVTLETGQVRKFSGTSLRRAEPPMGGDELLDEVEFLLDQGQSPLLVPQMVSRHPAVIARLARRYNRAAITEAFVAAGQAEYLRKKGLQ